MDDDITKKHLKSLVTPIEKTTDHMTLKFFQQTIILLKVDCFESKGILNQIKINGMANDHSSSCNS